MQVYISYLLYADSADALISYTASRHGLLAGHSAGARSRGDATGVVCYIP